MAEQHDCACKSTQDGEDDFTYANSVAETCVGVTNYGERCTRTRPGYYTHDTIWLCRDHQRQGPEAALGFGEALRQITTAVFERIAESLDGTVVYFIGDGRYVKIGVSRDPEGRLRALQGPRAGGTIIPPTCDRDALRLLHMIPGNARTESALHLHMRQFRVLGEWFSDSPEFWRRYASAGYPLPSPSATPLGGLPCLS